MDSAIAEEHGNVDKGELEAKQENESATCEHWDASEWVEVFDWRKTHVQGIKDLQIGEGLEYH